MNHLPRYILFSIYILLAHIAIAQSSSASTNNNWFAKQASRFHKIFYTFDTAYVQPIPYTYTVALKNPNWLYIYNFEFDKRAAISFNSDLNFNLGMALGFKSITVSYAISAVDAFSGKSIKADEWDIHMVNNQFSIDLYSSKNSERTTITSYIDFNGPQKINQPFYGLSSKTLELDIYYFFNKYRYSNAAAYSNGYKFRQVKSAGSIITGYSYSQQDISFDFTELQTTNQFPILNNFDKQTIQYHSYTVNIGYGYNLIFAKKWLANLTLIPAVGINKYRRKSDADDTFNHFSFNSKTKAAIVYNMPRFYMGIACHYYANWLFTENYTLTNAVGTFTVSVGARF